MAAQCRVLHVQAQRPLLPPVFTGGPNRAREGRVALPDGLHPFAMDHVERSAQTVKVMRGRGTAEILVKRLGVSARFPIPIGAHARHFFAHVCSAVAEEHKAAAGRAHQPLLGAGDHYVHAPRVHLKPFAGQRRDAIGHEQRGVVQIVKECTQRGKFVAGGAGRVDMGRQNRFVAVRLIGPQSVCDALEIKA